MKSHRSISCFALVGARARTAARVLAVALVLVAALIPAFAHAAPKSATPMYKSLKELAEKPLGMISGSLYGESLVKKEPSISLDDIETFQNIDELVIALENNQIEGFLSGGAPAEAIARNSSSLALMDATVADDNIGMCLQKNSKLTTLFNQRLDSLRMDGTLDILRSKDPESSDVLKMTQNINNNQKANGTLRVAYSTIRPMSYKNKNGDVVGYEATLVRLIANDLGYSVTFYNMPFKDVLSHVESGQADVGIGNITINEQRAKNVDFTIPDYTGSVVVVTHAVKNQAPSNVFLDLIRSFQKTFLDEGRWQVIASGLMATATISLITGVLGTPLAIVLVWRRYCGGRLTARIIDVFENLMSGVPVLVVLMVLYYVVFGRIHLPGEVVAIIAFVLSFAGRSAVLLWSAVQNVPKGQEESGLALGYTKGSAFFKIVLPQVARKTTTRLVNLYASVVKETAVVGYIAVQDLTRAGDYIRARTMDAFFPLVATALIYFIICSLLTWILQKVASRVIGQERRRLIKGVVR